MRVLTSLFILAAMISPALAGSPCTDLVPPAKYVFEPTVTYSVKRIGPERVTKFCGPPQNAFGRPVLACLPSAVNGRDVRQKVSFRESTPAPGW